MKGLQEHTARLKGRNEEMTEKKLHEVYEGVQSYTYKRASCEIANERKKIDVKSLHVSLLAANLS